MAQFSVRGKQVPGTLYELKSNNTETLRKAAVKSQNDGLDQVFFEAGNKTYLLEGDGLNLSAFKNGLMPRAQFTLGNETLNAQMIFVDNELNSAGEGVKSLGALIGSALVGSTAVGAGLLLKGSKEVTRQSLSLASQTQSLTQAVGNMSHLKNLPISIIEGLPPGFGNGLLGKNIAKGVSTQMKTSHSIVVDKGLKTVEGASKQVSQFSTAAQKSTSQVSQFSRGQKAIAIGIGVATAVTLGAAAYGAYKGSEMGRGEESPSLQALKGKVLNP